MAEGRPSLRALLGLGVSLGTCVGAAEVALRASPRLGMDTQGVLLWLTLSVALYVAYLLLAALVAWGIGRRSRGLIVAAAAVVQAALYYRFDLFLNEFFTDPVVWGGLSAIGLGCLLLGVLLDPLLQKADRLLRRGALGVAALAVGHAGALDHPEAAAARRTTPRGSPGGGRASCWSPWTPPGPISSHRMGPATTRPPSPASPERV